MCQVQPFISRRCGNRIPGEGGRRVTRIPPGRSIAELRAFPLGSVLCEANPLQSLDRGPHSHTSAQSSGFACWLACQNYTRMRECVLAPAQTFFAQGPPASLAARPSCASLPLSSSQGLQAQHRGASSRCVSVTHMVKPSSRWAMLWHCGSTINLSLAGADVINPYESAV